MDEYKWFFFIVVLFFAIFLLILFKLNKKKDIDDELKEHEIEFCKDCDYPLKKGEIEENLFFYKCPECSSIHISGANVKKIEQKLMSPDSVDFSNKFIVSIVNS